MPEKWQLQFYAQGVLFIAYSMFMIWNYYYLSESSICHSGPFSPWVMDYVYLLSGATAGTSASQYFRTFVALFGFSDGKLRHPSATALLLVISSIQSAAIILFSTGLLPYTCVDFLGIKTNPHLWWEWICTVPFMFFLTSTMDVKRNVLKQSDLVIEVYGGLSIIMLFGANLPLPHWLSWASFIAANVMMTLALVWQQYDAYDEYCLASEEMIAAAKKESHEFIPKEVHDRLRVSQCKMNASMFMSLFFTIFPLVYYLRWFNYLDDDTFIIITYVCSFLAKVLFTQVIGDSHVEILDPNKFLLVEEKKKAEESRLMFLRYVFHEVRVPLNSVALGLQLLQDSETISESDQETVGMMREATGFMAETLNDVLSLQKIEEGMLQLEMKPFSPYGLVKAVLSNFRTQYEAKRISVKFYLDPKVPPVLLGDQFRLEHVLGNLLSNSIKFSDPESVIVISVAYETRLKGHVTFSVTDQGPGMSPDEQKLLFQPFMQIRPGELQKGRGSGLGLSICKTIVTLHNGSIGCTSKIRQGDDRRSGGSEFFFSIEFNEPETPSNETVQPPPLSMRDRSQSYYTFETMQHGSGSRSGSEGGDEGGGKQVEKGRADSGNGDNNTTGGEQDDFRYRINNNNNRNSSSSQSSHHPAAIVRGASTNRANSSNSICSAVNKKEGSSLPPHDSPPPRQMIFANDMDYIKPIAPAARGTAPPLPISSKDSSPSLNSSKARSSSGDRKDGGIALTAITAAAVPSSSSWAATVEGVDESNNNNNSSSINDNSNNDNSSGTGNKTKDNIKRILVCDDVLSNRKMLNMILKRKGFDCDQCADGQEAVELFEKLGMDYYDIVFMDSVMPILSGPEAARRLREMGYARLLVGVTGNAMDLDIVDYETAGADVILTKPMRMEALDRLIDFCRCKGIVSHFKDASLPPADRVKAWVYGGAGVGVGVTAGATAATVTTLSAATATTK